MTICQVKPIDVVAMLLIENGKIFVAQRAIGDRYQKLWEFPGGKVQEQESFVQALTREIYEELQMVIRVKEYFLSVTDPERKINLHAFFCEHLSGVPKLNVHEAVSWVPFEGLLNLEMPPLDIQIASALIRHI